MSPIAPIYRIIWSADVPDEVTLMNHLDLMPELRIVKIDRLFVTDIGLGVIDRLNERGLMVFDDAKIVEIPSKVVGIAEQHLRYKPFMLNCMAGIESSDVLTHEDPEKIDGLKRFADACHQAGTKPCAVTVLTSKKPSVVAREFNGRSSEDQVLYYVELLLKCGFTDVVCSPGEVAVIRAESRFNVLDLNTPGIRPAGSDQGDQARVDTPEAALAAGATRLIIGRPITIGDPAENLKNIVAGITATA
jgi:orotidine-5'-phosphate decarboxylase